jgi:ATP-binding cassette subfamily B protein
MGAAAHLYGVSLAAVQLAKKRGEDPELAAMAALLHDLAAYESGSYDNHAHRGAALAQEVLSGLSLTSPEEEERICPGCGMADYEILHGKELTVKEGRIEFRHVSFRYYKNSEDKVLDDISLTIQPGTTVGIIGSTGCGKSTLVSMIPRLYDPDEGEVLVDGVNVKDYSLYNLREGVGMVLQKNELFSGTIAENLRWGDEEATAEEMTAMATAAQADKFVSTFKEGYETQLDKGGNNLSGGQKQRLCIARALMKKPKILILDDSTSAVDTATEAQIRHAFSHELAGSTKIIIAQRIASVMDADRIIVMNEGKITGVGTHEELLVSNTEYQEIAESQLGRKGA